MTPHLRGRALWPAVLHRPAGLLALAALALLGPSCGRIGTAEGPPNLIIILVDTLRADHLHYSGYARGTSPNIDALAAQSIVFENHYSTASRTGPAVASIITGLHPRSHGVINPLIHWDAKGVLGDEQTTLAELLEGEGYHCYGFITNPNVTDRFGFAQGFEHYQPIGSGSVKDVNNAALAILQQRPERPFFLYLHYMEPHSPYTAPIAYERLFVDSGYRGPITGEHAQLDEIVAGKLSIGASDVAELRGLYDQEIKFFDDEIGRFIQDLKDRGLYENTMIVFVADHGEEFLEHGSVLHGYTLYEDQLRVPLFIHDPREVKPRRVAAVTRHVDLLPTLLDMMDVDYLGDLQGQSLTPLMRGTPTEDWEVPVYADASLMAVKTVRKRSLMIEGWKIIETEIPSPAVELYHIAEDPGERHELSAARPEKLTLLLEQMRRLEEQMPLARSRTVKLREQEIEALRSLGYVK